MFPLQTPDLTMFQLPADRVATDAMFFLIGVGVVVVILVIVTLLKSRGKLSSLDGGSVSVKRRRRGFSAFTLHRIANDMGLNYEHAKMLEFVLRNDNVTDPLRSLDSPDMMDRHFKRAYFQIEETSISDDELNGRLSVLFSLRNTIESYTDTVAVASTRQILENTPATLAFDAFSYQTKVLSSHGETLIVEHPKNERGALANIPKDSKITLVFFTKSHKGFSITTRAVSFIETTNRHIIKLAHSNKIKKLSNRRFRRRQTVISANFYMVSMEPSSWKDKRLVVDKRKFTGKIMDISVGGCSMTTGVPMKAGSKIKIEFSQDDDFTVAALGEVLRSNRKGYNTVMHVKFLKIPRKSLNFINAMVYEYAYN